MNSFNRPVRISMAISCMQKMPAKDAASVMCDELHSFFVALGVPPVKIDPLEDEIMSYIPKLKGMPEDKAHAQLVGLLKERLSALGVSQPVIRGLRFE